MMPTDPALRAVRERALRSRGDAAARWDAAIGADRENRLPERAEQFATAGRLTLNFHPDRVDKSGSTVAAALLAGGRYRSRRATGTSDAGDGAAAEDPQRFERALFGFAYEAAGSATVEWPVYGAFDLLGDPHGGSPRFGSAYLVLAPHVRERTTMCIGDSRAGPRDVGTFDACWSLLAGLAEQAAAGALLDRGLGRGALLRALDGAVVAATPARRLDGYLEAQVHGGVDLSTDVDALVLDPSFTGTRVERDLADAAGRYGFELRRHDGSELAATDVPIDVHAPTMPDIARLAARPDGMVDAASIGVAVRRGQHPTPAPDEQFEQLWQTLLTVGRDARR